MKRMAAERERERENVCFMSRKWERAGERGRRERGEEIVRVVVNEKEEYIKRGKCLFESGGGDCKTLFLPLSLLLSLTVSLTFSPPPLSHTHAHTYSYAHASYSQSTHTHRKSNRENKRQRKSDAIWSKVSLWGVQISSRLPPSIVIESIFVRKNGQKLFLRCG
jgi:hypothetical protein